MSKKRKNLLVKLSIASLVAGGIAGGTFLALNQQKSYDNRINTNKQKQENFNQLLETQSETTEVENNLSEQSRIESRSSRQSSPLTSRYTHKFNETSMFQNLNDPQYDKYNNYALNVKPWKQLTSTHGTLNIAEYNESGLSLNVLWIPQGFNNNTLAQPKELTFDFSQWMNNNSIAQKLGSYDKVYYSGGIYSEKVGKFVVVMSFHVANTNLWQPAVFLVSQSSLDANSNAEVVLEVANFNLNNNGSVVDPWLRSISGSSLNNSKIMTYESENPIDFNVVPFFETSSYKKSSTENFLIYKYDPTYKFYSSTDSSCFAMENSRATNNPSFTNTTNNIFSTCIEIRSNDYNVSYNTDWFRHIPTQKGDVENNFDGNLLITLRPIIYDTHQPPVLGAIFSRYINSSKQGKYSSWFGLFNDMMENVDLTRFRIQEYGEGGTLTGKTIWYWSEPKWSSYAVQPRYITYKNLVTDKPATYENQKTFYSGFTVSYNLVRYNAYKDGDIQNFFFNSIVGFLSTNSNTYPSDWQSLFYTLTPNYFSWGLQDIYWQDVDFSAVWIDTKSNRLNFVSTYAKLPNYEESMQKYLRLGSLNFNYFLDWHIGWELPQKDSDYTNFNKILRDQLANNEAWCSNIYPTSGDAFWYPMNLPNSEPGLYFSPEIIFINDSLYFDVRSVDDEYNLYFNAYSYAKIPTDVKYIPKVDGGIDKNMNINQITPEMIKKSVITPYWNVQNQSVLSISPIYTGLSRDEWYNSIQIEIKRVNGDEKRGEISFYIKTKNKASIDYNGAPVFYGDHNGKLLNARDRMPIFKITGFSAYHTPTQLFKDRLEVPGKTNVNAKEFQLSDATNFLQSKLDDMFFSQTANEETAPQDAQVKITNYNFEPTLNAKGEIKVKFKLSKYYNAEGNLVQSDSPEYTVTLYGFKVINTEFKTVPIRYDEGVFREIFGNTSTYIADWMNNPTLLSQNEQKLLDFANRRPDMFMAYAPRDYGFGENTFTNITSAHVEGNVYKFVATANCLVNGELTQKPYTFEIHLQGVTDNVDFSDFQSYIQNKVNSHDGVLSEEATLKNWIAEYLKTKNLPPSVISQISPSKVNIGNFNNTTDPITASNITVNTNPQITLPNISIDVKVTWIQQNPIIATDPVNQFNASELVNLWNTNREDPKIKALEKWIDDNKTKIFADYYPGATITIRSISAYHDHPNSILLNLKVSKAYYSDRSPSPKSWADIEMKGFKAVEGTTDFLYANITAGDAKFKEIFGNDKGFASDWAHDLNNKKQILTNFLTDPNNYNKIFSEPIPDNPNIVVGDMTLNNNTARVSVTYDGYVNGVFTKNIQKEMVINLKPNPSASDVAFSDFQKYIQDRVNNENDGVVPNDETLKQWISDYLNTKKNDLPNSYIPNNGNGNFDPSYINVSVDRNKNPFTITSSTNGKNNTTPVDLPTIEISSRVTTAKSIAASGEIASYQASELDDLFKTNPNDPKIQKIQQFIQQNMSTIFVPVPSDSQVVSINSIKEESNTSIALNVTISKAYTNDGVVQKSFDFSITGFNSNQPNNTTLTLTTINANDPLFKQIFVNDKGFGIDWENKDNSQKANELKDFLNNNINTYFENPTTTIPTQVSNVTISPVANNQATATITFNGNKDGQYNGSITQNITIVLKNANDITNPDNPNSPFNDFNKWLQNKIDQNGGVLPNDETLKQWISDYLNEKKQDLPNAWIPGGENGSFGPNDINASVNSSSNPVQISASTNGNNGSVAITLPQASVNVKETTVKSSIKATSPISDLDPTYILSKWASDPTAPEFTTIKDWMNNNLNNIFNDLPADGKVLEIKNVTKGNKPDSLSFEIVVNKAYKPSGTNGIVENEKFTITIDGFINNTSSIGLINNTIKYSDKLFTDIFGANDKGFAVDWIKDHKPQEELLKNYMNAHKDTFFVNNTKPGDFSGVEVKSVNLSNINKETGLCTADIVYTGYDGNGWNDNISGQLTIQLRGQADIDKVLGGVSDVIQDFIDQNNRIPNNNEVKDIVSDYLNKNKDNLPNSSIPSDGKFDPSDINVNPNSPNKDEETGKITFKPGDISTNNPQDGSLSFPEVSATIILTKFNHNIINASGEISKLTPDELVQAINDKVEPIYSNFVSFIQNNATGQNGFLDNFTGVTSDIKLTEPTDIKIDPETGNVVVGVTVNNAQLFNGKGPLHDFVTINKDSLSTPNTSLNTVLKTDPIRWQNKALFQAIFGTKDKGFEEDWLNPKITPSLEIKATQLKDYINKNAIKFFDNVNTAIKPKVSSVVISASSVVRGVFTDVKFTAAITYSGYKAGAYVNNLNGNIDIFLRKMPKGPTKGPNQDIDTSNPDQIRDLENSENIYDNILAAVAGAVNNNGGKVPVDQLPDIIAGVINDNKANVADSWLPNDGKNNPVISGKDIIIDNSSITTGPSNNGNSEITIGDGWASIVHPETGVSEPLPGLGKIIYNSPFVSYTNNKWITWVIVGVCLAILIIFVILLITYILRRKRNEKNNSVE